jgi:hypothetical protein
MESTLTKSRLSELITKGLHFQDRVYIRKDCQTMLFREDQFAVLANIPFSTAELCLQNLPLSKIVSKKSRLPQAYNKPLNTA